MVKLSDQIKPKMVKYPSPFMTSPHSGLELTWVLSALRSSFPVTLITSESGFKGSQLIFFCCSHSECVRKLYSQVYSDQNRTLV